LDRPADVAKSRGTRDGADDGPDASAADPGCRAAHVGTFSIQNAVYVGYHVVGRPAVLGVLLRLLHHVVVCASSTFQSKAQTRACTNRKVAHPSGLVGRFILR